MNHEMVERACKTIATLKSVQPRMHKRPCRNCPSAHSPPDPQAQDMLTWPHQIRVEHAFPCGWNGVRYCRGYCNLMGITDDDLARLGPRA